jgi:hypothetical protein
MLREYFNVTRVFLKLVIKTSITDVEKHILEVTEEKQLGWF